MIYVEKMENCVGVCGKLGMNLSCEEFENQFLKDEKWW